MNKQQESLRNFPKNNDSTYDDSTVLGNWSICGMQDGTTIADFNSCPEILFLKNGSGYFNHISIFRWSLHKGKLNILKSGAENNILESGEYLATLQKGVEQMLFLKKEQKTLYLSK